MISTDELTLRIDERVLVENLQWHAQAGQCWSIIGCNGAGKSTLLRTLAGLHAPEAGQVHIQGRPLSAWAPDALARQRAFLAQSRHDAFAFSVMDSVLSARHPYHANRYWEGNDDHAIARQCLSELQVDHLARRDVRTLSGGERQRVAIAALLAQQTPLMLLDEPANALDLGHQISVTRLLARLCIDQQKTVVMVGHDLNLAHQASSHALLLKGDGRWHAGTVDETMQPELLSEFLGHPIDLIEHGARRIFIPRELPA